MNKKTVVPYCYKLSGASDGNRTRILTLARLRSTTELHLRLGFPNRAQLL